MKIRGLAHRGSPNKLPENTLASFQIALDLSFSHLELDVQLSKDGVPVVFHDTTIDRMTNGSGHVKDFTLAELRQFRIDGTELIPTLEEALHFLKDQIIVDIELKQMGNLYPGLEEAVVNTIKNLGMYDQVFITSFDHYSIKKTRQLDDKIEIGLINHGASPTLFSFINEIDGRYLSINYPYITEELIFLCKQNEITLIPWTVDREIDMNRFAQYPDLLVCTNELQKWIDVSSIKQKV